MRSIRPRGSKPLPMKVRPHASYRALSPQAISDNDDVGSGCESCLPRGKRYLRVSEGPISSPFFFNLQLHFAANYFPFQSAWNPQLAQRPDSRGLLQWLMGLLMHRLRPLLPDDGSPRNYAPIATKLNRTMLFSTSNTSWDINVSRAKQTQSLIILPKMKHLLQENLVTA